LAGQQCTCQILRVSGGNFFPVMSGNFFPVTRQNLSGHTPIMTGRFLPLITGKFLPVTLGVFECEVIEVGLLMTTAPADEMSALDQRSESTNVPSAPRREDRSQAWVGTSRPNRHVSD
jgi:hypothetical protein